MKPLLMSVLGAVLAAGSNHPAAQNSSIGATFVIRHDPELIKLDYQIVQSLLVGGRLAALKQIDGLQHLSPELGLSASLTPQPSGVFVGSFSVEFVAADGEQPELPSKTLDAALEQTVGILSAALRERLETAPLQRLHQQSTELQARLKDIAARRRNAGAADDREAELRKLVVALDDRARAMSDIQAQLASEMAARDALEHELQVTQKALAEHPDDETLRARIATITNQILQCTTRTTGLQAQLQSMDRDTEATRKRLTDLRTALTQAQPTSDVRLLDAEFDRVAATLAKVEDRIASFRPFEFEIWR